MTTPQNELYRLANNIQRLSDMFEVDEEDEEDIFYSIKQIRN